MSKVKLTGHSSGTGVLTVTSPDTDTDRTITLPDATGTLLNSDGSAASLTSIPAANITGTLPAIDGSNLTGLSSFDPDGAVTINESGADVNFRVESSANANALVVNGTHGAGIGVGAISSGEPLVVGSSSTTAYATTLTHATGDDCALAIRNESDTNGNFCGINFLDAGGFGNAGIFCVHDDHDAGGGGYLAFLTREDSTSADTMIEMMRLTGRKLLINRTEDAYDGGHLQVSGSATVTTEYVMNTGYGGTMTWMGCERSAYDGWYFAKWYSGRRPDTGGGDLEFKFRGDGNAYADGSFNNSGADYAEYFESHTGSAIPRGTSVVLENNKVRAATSEDDVADIIGVARPKQFGKNSMVVGNTAWNMWSEKYLTDDFNCYVMEDYSVVSWNDESGELVTYESDNIPSDVTVPDDAETNTHDENGAKFQRRALNPDFDDSLTYEPREDRDEWVIVGLIGQVQILDGQPTNDSWIKMRDISDTVEEWYIR